METIETIRALIGIVGAGMTLGEVVTWLQVEENAERLRAEGHENGSAETSEQE